jgi:trimeric autotransporter adhesin
LDTAGDSDRVVGSAGIVDLLSAQATIVGGADTIRLLGASDDSVTLVGTAASADSVHGSDAIIVLNSADASVSGSDDTIKMFGASDTASKNGADDTFVFHPAIGQDTINGFSSTDSIRFSASDFANWAALVPAISQSGANTVITLDASDTITLTGVTATSLTQGQFHFV